ncbi:carbohydrate-binding protein [Streptomyces sp. NPDC096176]|uniref:carbohydrate-binding protein n=1 Tax=Streptomyces sp. NPDC096176 TaxID=3366079 RepID=UPI0037FA9481
MGGGEQRVRGHGRLIGGRHPRPDDAGRTRRDRAAARPVADDAGGELRRLRRRAAGRRVQGARHRGGRRVLERLAAVRPRGPARGARRLTARVAKESSGAGTLEVRLGAPDGRLAGTATVESTGSRYAYADVTAPLQGAARRQAWSSARACG